MFATTPLFFSVYNGHKMANGGGKGDRNHCNESYIFSIKPYNQPQCHSSINDTNFRFDK